MQRDRDPSGNKGPSHAQRRAASDGSTPGPDAVTHRDNIHAADLYRADPYCAVTIVCGPSRLDLALPTAVCSSDLLPGLLRLMFPDEPPAGAQPWVLIPIGRNPLTGSETLSEAEVLDGDLLVLEQRPVLRQAGPDGVMTRDRIEDLANGQDRFWDPPAVRSFARWAALLTWTVLLLPAANLPAGPAQAAVAATVTLFVAMTAVRSGRRSEGTATTAVQSARQSERVCAAAGLVLACIWAALAGAVAFRGWVAAAPLTGPAVGWMTLTVAVGSALLLAGCAATSYPSALVHTTALLVVGICCAGLVAAINAGAQVVNAGCVTALVAVLLLGGLPRLALATGGLTGSALGRNSADLDDRINRADRVLIGCLTGVSIVAAGAVIPAALSSAVGPRVLAVGIGLLLLLRSRAYSQTRHVLGPRIGGLLVFGLGWLGVFRDNIAQQAMLIVGAAVAMAAAVVVFEVLGRSPSAVGLARRGRLLDLAEQLLVVVLVVLTAWVAVLADWVVSVIG